MFPTSIAGQIDLKVVLPGDIDRVLGRIEQALDAAGAIQIIRSGNRVTFRGGLFRFVGSWNILAPVGYGEIEILEGEPGAVRYKFSCVQMLIVASAMAGVLGYSTKSFGFFVICWLGLFGMNYLAALVRLPDWVRRTAVARQPGRGQTGRRMR